MKLFLLLALTLITGCATSYQAHGLTGGFTEMHRGDNVYLVRFQGNGYTSDIQAEEMAFLRAAELAKEKGFAYFAVLSEGTRGRASTITTPSQTRISGSMDRWGNYRGTATTTPGGSIDVTRYQARLLVGLSNDKFGDYRWATASEVIGELGPKYKKP